MIRRFHRYLRLYGYFVRFSLTRTFEFRIDFWFRVFMDVVYAAILIVFYKILYAKTSMLGGWSQSEALVFVGACLIVDSFQMTFFSDNLNSLQEKVNKGDVDYYLVRPVSALFFLTLRDVSLNSFFNLLISIGIFLYYLFQLPMVPSFGSVLWFIFLLLNGAVLYYLVRLLFVLPVFWLGSIKGLDGLFYNLYYIVDRPDKIFRGIVRFLLTSILPFCVMVSFPTRAFFDGSDPLLIAHIFGTTLALSCLTYVVWRKCLRAYSSASS